MCRDRAPRGISSVGEVRPVWKICAVGQSAVEIGGVAVVAGAALVQPLSTAL
jgi:hypothetical protein